MNPAAGSARSREPAADPGAGAARPVTAVAVGVLVRADGAVLLADRPAGKPYAGYWEFPGGKVEPGETVAQALTRELDEELGVQIRDSTPWVVMEYDYPHAYVRLHFRRVHQWSGTLRPVEGQQLLFVHPGDPPPAPLLPAAVPAMRWIQLPTVTALSPQTATTAADATQWLAGVLARGVRQVVWREPLLPDAEHAVALTACRALAQRHGARLLVDAGLPHPSALAQSDDRASREQRPHLAGDGPDVDKQAPSADGAFLGAGELRIAVRRPHVDWLGADVDTEGDLARAAALGCDFAVLASADAAGLLAAAPLPVYLRTALDLESLRLAQCAGAHGLAVEIDNANEPPC